MKKKQYKIVKSNRFKQQEGKLPPKVKKELKKALKAIAKNPIKTPNSMRLFTPPSPEELRQWMSEIKPSAIDLMFEYLAQKHCLNSKGSKLAKEFYNKHIKER